ncbi:ATPase [Caerostris extrusa]|uniref:ATPase n=1 Tax=Caerostris extrusa TaxID=172846 RepID=A0AAV4U5K7_CAEEX|nr:ATPase [Caerostris extrusa]
MEHLDSLSKEFRPSLLGRLRQFLATGRDSSDESRLHMPEVKHFFETVLPAREERDYVLHFFFGRLLDGHRDEKQFLVLTDKRDGNNGKTTFINLMEVYFLRMRCVKVPKRFANSPEKRINSHNAGLARFKGIRLLIVDDLKKDQTLKSSFLKREAGGRPVSMGEICIRPKYSSLVGKRNRAHYERRDFQNLILSMKHS